MPTYTIEMRGSYAFVAEHWTAWANFVKSRFSDDETLKFARVSEFNWNEFVNAVDQVTKRLPDHDPVKQKLLFCVNPLLLGRDTDHFSKELLKLVTVESEKQRSKEKPRKLGRNGGLAKAGKKTSITQFVIKAGRYLVREGVLTGKSYRANAKIFMDSLDEAEYCYKDGDKVLVQFLNEPAENNKKELAVEYIDSKTGAKGSLTLGSLEGTFKRYWQDIENTSDK